MMTTRTLSAAALAGVTAVALLACSSSRDDSQAATITAAQSASHADPRAKTGFVIGLDDDAPAHVVYGSADKFTARCHGSGDARTVEISTADGWRVVLTHGSQTLSAENPTLNFPAAEFTTAPATIDSSQRTARNPDAFPLGVTWDRPSSDDVEVKLKEEVPTSWPAARRNTELLVFMHLRCGA